MRRIQVNLSFMRDSGVRKTEFLGMPAGTAFARLRKLVLFNLLQKYGEDVCFRCQEKIARVEELSIEHKQPWEGISIELFWDLANIAFSHLRCNLPHSYKANFSHFVTDSRKTTATRVLSSNFSLRFMLRKTQTKV